jgi:hypothetical protein
MDRRATARMRMGTVMMTLGAGSRGDFKGERGLKGTARMCCKGRVGSCADLGYSADVFSLEWSFASSLVIPTPSTPPSTSTSTLPSPPHPLNSSFPTDGDGPAYLSMPTTLSRGVVSIRTGGLLDSSL